MNPPSQQETQGLGISSVIWGSQIIICSWFSCFNLFSLIPILSSFTWMLFLDIDVVMLKHHLQTDLPEISSTFLSPKLRKRKTALLDDKEGSRTLCTGGVVQTSASPGSCGTISVAIPSCWGRASLVPIELLSRSLPPLGNMWGLSLGGNDYIEHTDQCYIIGKKI